MVPDGTVDNRTLDRLQAVLSEHSIGLGVLFGSQATSAAGSHSDIDIAVEFLPSVDDPFKARLTLGANLACALGTDDIDVVDLQRVRPAVGYSALRSGTVIVGDAKRAEELLAQFDSERERSTSAERRERFDNALDRLKELV
ncbi:MAG: nucleotidyltransferase domain-containing protein [Halohasta sp.]